MNFQDSSAKMISAPAGQEQRYYLLTEEPPKITAFAAGVWVRYAVGHHALLHYGDHNWILLILSIR